MRKMDRNGKRTVIKYLHLKRLNAVEISTELNSVLGDYAPSDATVYRRIAEFQRGRKLSYIHFYSPILHGRHNK